MSVQSNNQGRAYEYICLMTLYEEINKFRVSKIIKNSSFDIAQKAWMRVASDIQEVLKESAKAVITTVFDLEPMIVEQCEDILMLEIQADNEGEKGEVRDILILSVV